MKGAVWPLSQNDYGTGVYPCLKKYTSGFILAIIPKATAQSKTWGDQGAAAMDEEGESSDQRLSGWETAQATG